MMNQIELDAYFARIGLPVRGRRLVEKARRASPVRKVQSRTGNVLTHFPSRKMQKVVVAESRTVEFPAFMRYEHDPDVLEYYPQPVSLDLRTEIGPAAGPGRGRRQPLQEQPTLGGGRRGRVVRGRVRPAENR